MPKIRRKKPIKRRLHGDCFHTGCKRQAVGRLECLTCEKLAAHAKIKVEEIHSLGACEAHWADGVAKMKKHTLTKHPLNILRATGAALTGEEVF